MQAWRFSVCEIRAAMLKGEISCAEYVDELIERASRAHPLNIWMDTDFDRLREEATQCDSSGAPRDPTVPLAGIPFGIKDNIEVAGLRCTAGTPLLDQYRPVSDAPSVAQLRAAGALVMGKTGMHELAMGVTNNNAYSGAVRNPYAPNHSPGGSSGGSAAAVAAGVVPAALGTDTGGSVRYPAAACNLVGLRPTAGRYNREGVFPLSRTRDTLGPMARTVADVALIDSVLTGQWNQPEVALKQVRIGVPREGFWDDADPSVAECVHQALATLAQAGAELIEVRPFGAEILDAEIGFQLGRFEMSEDLPRYLASIGFPISLAQLQKNIASPDVAASVATRLLPSAIGIEGYREAQRWRASLQAKYANIFQVHRLDVLAFPTALLTPPRLGQDITVLLNGEERPLFPVYARNTSPASLAGLPGISIPVGMLQGLPVGMEFDAPPHTDRRLLTIAAQAEALLPRFELPCGADWADFATT